MSLVELLFEVEIGVFRGVGSRPGELGGDQIQEHPRPGSFGLLERVDGPVEIEQAAHEKIMGGIDDALDSGSLRVTEKSGAEALVIEVDRIGSSSEGSLGLVEASVSPGLEQERIVDVRGSIAGSGKFFRFPCRLGLITDCGLRSE